MMTIWGKRVELTEQMQATVDAGINGAWIRWRTRNPQSAHVEIPPGLLPRLYNRFFEANVKREAWKMLDPIDGIERRYQQIRDLTPDEVVELNDELDYAIVRYLGETALATLANRARREGTG